MVLFYYYPIFAFEIRRNMICHCSYSQWGTKMKTGFFTLELPCSFTNPFCSFFSKIFITPSKNKQHWLIRVTWFLIMLCCKKSLVLLLCYCIHLLIYAHFLWWWTSELPLINYQWAFDYFAFLFFLYRVIGWFPLFDG